MYIFLFLLQEKHWPQLVKRSSHEPSVCASAAGPSWCPCAWFIRLGQDRCSRQGKGSRLPLSAAVSPDRGLAHFPRSVTFTITHFIRRIPVQVSVAVRPLVAFLVVLLFSLQVILHILHILPFKDHAPVMWQKYLSHSLWTEGRNAPTSNRRLKKKFFRSVIVVGIQWKWHYNVVCF